MSRHYCARHPSRGRSHYPERLEARGLSKAPRMEPLDPLRKRQEARVERGQPPWRVWAAEDAEP
jgi:hypothetical protein